MRQLENVILVNFFLIEQATLKMEPVTGLFGPNGSGKSSVLDAIQIAMMGADGNQISLNAQADDKSVRRSPRRIRDYVLGRFGVEEGEEVRPSAITYITLIFRDTASGEPLSMGVCLSAQRNKDGHETLGQYLLPGVELALSDHLSRVGGEDRPLDWNSFHIELERKAKISGVEEFVFHSAERFTKAYLFAMRSSAGTPPIDAFRRAYRFGLRMRFDQTVEEIVKTQVLEARPVDIKKFREIVDNIGRLAAIVKGVTAKIEAGKKVKTHFDRVKSEQRKAITWQALAADAEAEHAISEHEASRRGLDDAREELERVEQALKTSETAKRTAEGELSRLTTLITGHVAHQQLGAGLAALEEKEREATNAKSTFRQAITLICRLLDAAAASNYLPALAPGLREAARDLDRWSGIQAEQSTRVEAEAALTPLMSALSNAFTGLQKLLVDLTRQQELLTERLNRQRKSLERARVGKAALDDDVQDMQDALAAAGIRTDPVCDLVRVSDPEWQPAVEAYLGRNRQALLICDPAQEEAAFDVYRATPRVYGVKLVLPSQNRHLHTPAPGTVAELLVGDSVPAVAFLRSIFGSTLRATDSRAVRQSRALTADGMRVSSGSIDRLRLSESLLLGGGRSDAEQATHLAREIESTKRELDAVDSQMQQVSALQRNLGRFAESAHGLETVLAAFDNILTCQAEVDRRRRLLEEAADEEYQELIALQQAERARIAALDGEVTELTRQQIRIATRVEGLEAEHQRRGEVADARREAAERERAHAEFDAQMALTAWDQLLGDLKSDYLEMAARAKVLSSESAGASRRALERALENVATFARDFSETLPPIAEDDADAWRARATWLDDLLQRLEQTDLPSYTDQVNHAHKTAEETFRKDVAVKINDNLQYLQDHLNGLNAVLRSSPAFSNGERYAFHSKLKEEHRALFDFIRAVGSGSDIELFGDSTGGVPEQFRVLIERSGAQGKAGEVTPLQDYREFYHFDIEILREDPSTRTSRRVTMLSKRLGPSSGGEHRAPLYVIAGAALASSYRISKPGTTGGLRLMSLDEAFDKMDDNNTIATLRYLESLGLQVVMAGPGKDIGVLNAFLHRYYEVSRDPERQVMSFSGHSISPAMRELNRSDRYEFHPELLDQAIRAMEAVEGTRTPAVS